jgi:hypothetical protein
MHGTYCEIDTESLKQYLIAIPYACTGKNEYDRETLD